MIYLDHNATAPLRPAALAAMTAGFAAAGNPSSPHGPGRAARAAVDAARARVAALAGADPEAVVFTSGGTEANALALHGFAPERILVSAIEHVSIRDAARPPAELVPVDGDGVVDLDRLDRMLADPVAAGRRTLVACMLANNETGVIQPVAEAARIAHAHGAVLHCDAAQAAGRIPLDFAALGADSMTLSAHKLGGPQGVGALVLARGREVRPLLRGGGQERGRRAGTENVAGIAGFGAAAHEAAAGRPDMARLATWRDRIEAGMRGLVPGTVVHGAAAARLPNTASVAVPGLAAEVQVMAFDLAGVAIGAGAACSSGKVAASHVLNAMGVPAELARCTVRLSLGWNSVAGDVEAFLAAFAALAARIDRR